MALLSLQSDGHTTSKRYSPAISLSDPSVCMRAHGNKPLQIICCACLLLQSKNYDMSSDCSTCVGAESIQCVEGQQNCSVYLQHHINQGKIQRGREVGLYTPPTVELCEL